MRYLVLWIRLQWLVVFCLIMLLGGCQQKAAVAPATVTPEETSTVPAATDEEQETDIDHGCSYFYFLWGRHAELLMHFDEALEAYQNALICDPNASLITKKIPVILLRLKRNVEAEQWLKEYLGDHPKDVGMRMLYAKVLLQLKQSAAAMHQYQMISEQNPNDPTVLLLLAEMYTGDKQYGKARAILEGILAKDPTAYSAHVLMARLCQLEKKTDQAFTHYHTALVYNWSSDLQMELADLYIKVTRVDKAIKLYQDILLKDEQNEGARIALIHAYLLQDREDLALAQLHALKSYVDQPQRVDLTIARLYAKQKEYGKATQLVRNILKKENLPEARYLLAMLLLEKNKYGQAMAELDQISPDAKEFAEALVLQVKILKEHDRPVEAIKLINSALVETDMRNPELYLMLAALHDLTGRPDLSRKALLDGLHHHKNNEELLYEYGLLLENSGDHQGALAAMQKIIRLKPNNAAALNFVGYSWADKKIHLDLALKYIQRAIKLKPDNGYIRDSLGWVYFRMGQVDRARTELETAVKLSPEDPAILEHLGDVYVASGKVQDALTAYRKALGHAKDDKELAKSLHEKIQTLEQQEKH